MGFNPEVFLAEGDTQGSEFNPEEFLNSDTGGFKSEEQRQGYINSLPELTGIFANEEPSKVAAILPALMTAVDANEFAQIVKSQFPHIQAVYPDKDADPLLVNTDTGYKVQINKKGLSPTDLIQFGTLMAAYSPAGRVSGLTASALGKVMAGEALTEAGIQGVQSASGGEFGVGDVATTAAFAPVGQVVGEKVIEPVIGAAKNYVSDRLLPKAGEIVEAGKEFEIPVTTTDVMPVRSKAGGQVQQLSEGMPVVGTGATREAQRLGREKVTREFGERLEPYSELDMVQDLIDQKDKVKSAAGKRIQKVTDDMIVLGDIDITSTIDLIDDIIEKQVRTGKISDEAFINKLNKIREELMSGGQDFGLLRENRTAIRELKDTIDPRTQSQARSSSAADLDRLYNEITKTLDGFVLKNSGEDAFKRYKHADSVYASEVRNLKQGRIKSVLDNGTVKPEAVIDLLKSKKPSELKLLYKTLSPKGRDNARAALLHLAWEGVEDEAGRVSPKKLASNLRKLEAQYSEFFKGAQKIKIEGLRKILSATTRGDDAKVITPTGMMNNIFLVLGGGGAALTGNKPMGSAAVLAGGLSGFSTAYESAAMRDFLIKLGSAERGSATERALIDKFTSFTVPSVAAAKSEILAGGNEDNKKEQRLKELREKFGL